MADSLRAEVFLDNPQALGRELEQDGALQFLVRPSGLFAASDIANAELARLTGMGMAWLRDSAHVGNALHQRDEGDDIAKARGAGRAMLEILQRNEELLIDFIYDPDGPHLPVRVDAETLENDSEQRVQHDSTAYTLWLPGRLMLDGTLTPSRDDLGMMALVAKYLAAGRYWQVPDEGIWEEDSQIHASSIGVAIAGLRVAAQVFDREDYRAGVDIQALIGRGENALETILPYGETLPTDAYVGRQCDASHLFLVETVGLFDGDKAAESRAVNRIEDRLVRDIGIIRYPGDSYYAPGFTALLRPGERTSQGEGRLDLRNSLSADAEKTRSEAQWTLFDPILSAYWGRRYGETRDRTARARQLHYLNRALQHYVPVDTRGLRVPELFYKDTLEAALQPNDHIPLVWSQANMLLALKQFERTT